MSRRHRALFVLLICTLLPVSALAVGTNAYRQGVDAFRAADYDAALSLFQQAEAEGMRTATLLYNLGATHYRLGDYNNSALYFMRIRFDKEWGALAEYNLGLIAEKQQYRATAERHYHEAIRKTDVERLRAFAQARLNALAEAEALDPAPRWMRYLSVAMGYDDNPALMRDSDFPPGKDSDIFIESVGFVSGYLRGNRYDGLRLNAGFYSRNHDDATEFDVSGIFGGVYLDNAGANWRLLRGLSADNYWIDGEQYSSAVNVILQATRLLEATSLDIKNEISYIEGDGDFDFISGFRNRLSMAVFRGTGTGDWRIGLIGEYNNRDDFSDGDVFLSYSPWRSAIYGQLRRPLSSRLSLQGHLEYRHSRYQDDNRERNPDSSITEKQREDNRIRASLIMRYRISRIVSTFLEYRYTDNDSNFGRFSYESHQLMLGVDVGF